MTVCEQCENSFGHVGMHWRQSTVCGYPQFAEEQWEILVGLLMGDGTVAYSGNRSEGSYPYFQLMMNNERFVEWVSEKLGNLSSDVRRHEASTTWTDNAIRYEVRTKCHPRIKELRAWYESGKKEFPDNLSLTPTITKMWYVSDGSYHVDKRKGRNPHVVISNTTETHRPDYLINLFDEVGFDASVGNERFRLPTSQTDEFLAWLGDPPSGFEYKWGNEK